MSEGELDEREFACETGLWFECWSLWEIKWEFRRNNPELGVTNGLAGTLVEADTARFLVRVSVGEQYRDIAFDAGNILFRLGVCNDLLPSSRRRTGRGAYLSLSSYG